MFYIYYYDILHKTDNMTRLLNRRSYDNRMRLESRRVVILMADVDSFKTVNVRFGHQFVDVCLAQIGAALKEAYGRYGLCYRIGGDEFCVVLDKALETAAAEADKMMYIFKQKAKSGGSAEVVL